MRFKGIFILRVERKYRCKPPSTGNSLMYGHGLNERGDLAVGYSSTSVCPRLVLIYGHFADCRVLQDTPANLILETPNSYLSMIYEVLNNIWHPLPAGHIIRARLVPNLVRSRARAEAPYIQRKRQLQDRSNFKIEAKKLLGDLHRFQSQGIIGIDRFYSLYIFRQCSLQKDIYRGPWYHSICISSLTFIEII